MPRFPEGRYTTGPSWALWPQLDPSAPVAYRGQVVELWDRAYTRSLWLCDHRHSSTDEALDCARTAYAALDSRAVADEREAHYWRQAEPLDPRD